MPAVQWKWEVGPQTIISGLNLLVMLGGIIAILSGVEADIKIAKEQVADLRSAVATLAIAQSQQAVDSATIRAKVDLILPKIEKIEDTLIQHGSLSYPR
jgi:hypothetical protein